MSRIILISSVRAVVGCRYVPLLWPLPGWEFREHSIEGAAGRARAKYWKPRLDVASVTRWAAHVTWHTPQQRYLILAR